MKILAIDTTQEVCSAALFIDDELLYREQQAPREHTRLILPQVESLLDEAGLKLVELDALAFGRGPGSFTGLRIASGVIQGLAMGADLPVAPVSSLAALAQGIYREKPATTHVCAAFDARIEEVYWGNYELTEGIMTALTDEAVSSPEDVYLSAAAEWIATGSGWLAYPQMEARLGGQISEIIADRVPLARDILPIALSMSKNNQLVAAEQALPVYLRNKVAQTIEERAHSRNMND